MTSLEIFLALVLLVTFGALGFRHFVASIRSRMTRRGLMPFTSLPEIATFQEALPRFHGGSQTHEHAVLLLHGYSATPGEFTSLTEALSDAGIPHYAPLLTGFGLDDCRLLSHTRHTDWLRDAILAFDLLESIAKEVSVVGHSNGASLATYLAQQRRVKHLVLSGPNLIPSAEDIKYKTLLRTPVLSALLPWLIPFFRKPLREGRTARTDTLDPEAAVRCLHYEALPTKSLIAAYDLQDMVNLSEARCETLTIFHGEHDLTVNMDETFEYMRKENIRFKDIEVANSGHNVLEDHERHAVAKQVIEILIAR